MKHIYCYIFLSIWGVCWGAAASLSPTDSLLNLAKNATDDASRISAYRNLADIYFEKPEETYFLKQNYRVAEAAGRKEDMFDALTDLAFAYIKTHQMDSALCYMKVVEKAGKPEETIPYLSFLRMRLYEGRYRNNDGQKAVDEELEFLKNSPVEKDNIFMQIEQAYITGFGLYSQSKYEDSYPYLETAYKLAGTLPDREGKKLQIFVTWSYLNVLNFLDRGKQFIEGVEKLLQQYKDDYQQYYAQHRPYYNMNIRYLQCYTALLMRTDILGKEKIDYYIKQIKKASVEATEAIDKYNCFLAMNNYYLYKEDYVNALATNDSLIKYAHIISPSNVPGLLDISSQIYEAMGDYKEAYKYYKASAQARDSITTSAMKQQLNELQVYSEGDK